MDTPDTFSSKRTIKQLRRHLAEIKRLLYRWSHTLLIRREQVNAEALRLMKEPIPESVPIERFDCCELFKGALIVERIAALQLELQDVEKDLSGLERLDRGWSK